MKPNLSAAQAAQQSNRDTGGRYAEKVHAEQGMFTPPAPAAGVEVKRWPDGEVEHWLDGALHRVDGPAHVHYKDYGQPDPLRVEEFWQYGKRHRLDGPAVSHFFESVSFNGDKFDDPWAEENEFWVDGVEVDETGFEAAAAAFRAAHAETRDDDCTDYAQVYGVEGANQFNAVHAILEHLQGNGWDTGHATARRTPDGGWEVWGYSDEEAAQDDPSGWVEADGDISAYLTDTADGPVFDVGKAARDWQGIDDDDAIAALLNLATR